MRTLQSQIVWSTRAQKTLGVIALLAIAGFVLAGYMPQTRKLRQLTEDTRQKERELIDNQHKAVKKNEIAAGNEQLRLQLDLIKKPSKSGDIAEILKELTSAKERTSLKRYDHRPGTPTRTDLFLEVPTTLTFESDFMNVFNFLRSMEDMPRLTRLRYLQLRNIAGKSGTVQAKVAMNFYYTADESGE